MDRHQRHDRLRGGAGGNLMLLTQRKKMESLVNSIPCALDPCPIRLYMLAEGTQY